jgi:hypothetical protein
MVKVKGSAAASILEAVEAAGIAAGVPPPPQDFDTEMDDEKAPWDLFYQYCDALRSQAARPSGGVLHKKNAKAKADKAKADAGRRISFAPEVMGDDVEEDELGGEEDSKPAPAGRNGRTGKKAKAVGGRAPTAARVDLSAPEEEDEPWDDDDDEQQEEDEGNGTGAAMDVMPSEEQLPKMIRGNRGSQKRAPEPTKVADGNTDDDTDDEDEPVGARRRRRR